ncbi:hypothetical protein GH5_08143 [Leishmania sp. Ghana 2012 LV757]|uniref:hypothetical protein n=1 Tax=Leishmania sp. Ghana 2012 LV757 TaxID=2803181 RepID=UPI001B6E12D3|nr:hypothetical protein GH5_08143 [Leishmania sp. Ghana 2012 LV757]
MSLFSLSAPLRWPPAPKRPHECVASTGVSLPIAPPCVARRVMPLFPPPGCHMYDAYRNCFQYRPDAQQKIREAVQQERRHQQQVASLSPEDAAAMTVEANAAASRKAAEMEDGASCRCALDAAQLFATPADVPNPPLPLSRCELHEVLLALSPSWQSYPWRRCFDTATDGFSLSSLYRCMEVVEAKQSQVKTVAFGLFFVHCREDAALSVAQDPSPSESVSSSPVRTSCGTSPATGDSSHSFRAAQRFSSLRYGAAHGTPLHYVLCCFTPEVPCLGRHPANIYFGSTGTFVFRLNQLSCTASRGAWMTTDLEKKERQLQAEQQRQQRHSNAADSLGARSLKRSAAEPHTCAHATATAAVAASPVYGYARLVVMDDGEAGVPVPMPSRMTIEHLPCPERTVDPSVMTSSPLSPPPTNLSPLRTALVSLSNAAAVSGVSNAVDAAMPSPLRRRHRSLRALPPVRAVPQAPLLEKYMWCGHASNKRFIVCNPHFFAIGGGKNGAALYVDEALQYGTSSLWCETFNAPCLCGPRMGSTEASPTSSPASSPLCGEEGLRDGPVTTPVAARGGSARQSSGLPHVEFVINRVVWFSITEDKRDLRTMSPLAASLSSAEAHLCGCGRCSSATPSSNAPLDSMAPAATLTPSVPRASMFVHRCDLLPFAVPM